ncbi:MAG: sigma-70 family RNA polymerase sigma factor [Deltaproteobacteria bacterium]|nr:sigma-70 family RNA polymerase sigma factor [Deltaproteobacteria bacterium]
MAMALSNRQRFEDEVLPHLDALYGLALRLCRDRQEAEDLLQDALVKAFRFFDHFESGSNVKAWLFRVLTNVFYNAYRKAKNIERLEQTAETEGHHHRFLATASTGGMNGEDALLGHITNEKLREVVDTLPEDYRVVVILCDVYGFSYREIADIIDRPVGTVMSRLHRARRILQKLLLRYGIERGLVEAPEEATEQEGRVAEIVPLHSGHEDRKKGQSQ